MTNKRDAVPLYDTNYGNFHKALYEEIRKEAFGEDIGQNSWISADEQDVYLPMLNLSKGKTQLDVACGSGGPLLRIAAKTGCSVVGIDVNKAALTTAKELADQRGLNHLSRFQSVDATSRLPFDDGAFDAITCIDAINHLPDRPKVIAEWKRVLKAGGRILFTDPITVTGYLTAEEIAVRSSIGIFLFVPENYDAHVIDRCGLRLLVREDVTENMARIAHRRHAARASRASALREIEGDDTFEGQQNFLQVAAKLAAERRLSRFLFIAEK